MHPNCSHTDETKSFHALFRPLFRDDMKIESKLKIVEKHVTEKRKLASDVKSRMEKHGKNIDEIKVKSVHSKTCFGNARACALRTDSFFM